MRNGRCRMYGGKSTGPRTAAGLRLNRTVAIKILPDTLAADPQFRERFDREARAISQPVNAVPARARWGVWFCVAKPQCSSGLKDRCVRVDQFVLVVRTVVRRRPKAL